METPTNHNPPQTQGVLIDPTGLELKLPQFSGPMDLLLHMIRENQLNIHDIPIGEITEAYLTVIRRAQAIEFEVAGEFLVMASLLLYLKSRTLLPPDENETEEEDPQERLVRQLIAYEQAKAAAEALKSGELLGRDTFVREDALQAIKDLDWPESESMEIQPGTIFKLAVAYLNLLKQLDSKQIQMMVEPINYKEFFHEMIQTLAAQQTHSFDFSKLSQAKQAALIQRVVLTILVLLELSKRGVIQLKQDQHYGEVHLDVLNSEELLQLKPELDTPPEPPEPAAEAPHVG